MARVIQSVPELYTDEIVDLGGGVFEVSFHMRVIFVDGDPNGEWHYYGTSAPPEATQHPASHFPFNITVLEDAPALLYDLAVQSERTALEA